MNHKLKLEVNPGAVLTFSLLFFFDSFGLIAAAIPAVLVHELAHYCALRRCGAHLTCLRVGAFGLEMDYAGELYGVRALLCCAAGPLAGMFYAFPACSAGGSFLKKSGTISFLLSVFNLMPVLPLDGGRIVAAVTDETFARLLSRISALLLLAAGAVMAMLCGTWTLFVLGLWLTLRNFKS